MGRKGAYSERKVRDMAEEAGCFVGAGIGATGLDGAVVRPDGEPGFAYEVKSIQNGNAWYWTDHAREQRDELKRLRRNGIESYMVVHYKSGPLEGRVRAWPAYDLTDEPLRREQGIRFEELLP